MRPSLRFRMELLDTSQSITEVPGYKEINIISHNPSQTGRNLKILAGTGLISSSSCLTWQYLNTFLSFILWASLLLVKMTSARFFPKTSLCSTELRAVLIYLETLSSVLFLLNGKEEQELLTCKAVIEYFLIFFQFQLLYSLFRIFHWEVQSTVHKKNQRNC